MFAEAPRPIMGTPTGFHPNHDRGQLSHKGHQGAPRYALPQHDIARVAQTHDMDHLLSKINPEDAHL
jgi:hypothetical protein